MPCAAADPCAVKSDLDLGTDSMGEDGSAMMGEEYRGYGSDLYEPLVRDAV